MLSSGLLGLQGGVLPPAVLPGLPMMSELEGAAEAASARALFTAAEASPKESAASAGTAETAETAETAAEAEACGLKAAPSHGPGELRNG